MNYFGDKIKELRQSKNLLQKHVANRLNIDAPMLSKIERGERKPKKEQIKTFAQILSVKADDLISLWLADKVYEVVKDEKTALQAIGVAEKQIRVNSKNNK